MTRTGMMAEMVNFNLPAGAHFPWLVQYRVRKSDHDLWSWRHCVSSLQSRSENTSVEEPSVRHTTLWRENLELPHGCKVEHALADALSALRSFRFAPSNDVSHVGLMTKIAPPFPELMEWEKKPRVHRPINAFPPHAVAGYMDMVNFPYMPLEIEPSTIPFPQFDSVLSRSPGSNRL
jgi:hypothetical protein